MNGSVNQIISLYDGTRSSKEVASVVGLSARYVRRIAARLGLARLHVGSRRGSANHQFVAGRRIDLDGYVLITPPPNHPSARKRKDRPSEVMFEHRLVLEKKLGRRLTPSEASHHIDGLTLHNDPSNLQLFDQNKIHLQATLQGRKKQISVSGQKNIATRNHRDEGWKPVDTYYRRRERGDVRLRQILLAALKLGIDSPYLLGTHHHLKKAGIDPTSRSSLERALAELFLRWEQDLLL